MNSTKPALHSHDVLQVQTLVYVLLLGGLVGCLDPFLESRVGIRATIAFWSGVGLIALVPVLWYTKRVQPVMCAGIAIAWTCFFSFYLLSGDHFYLAHGISVPIAAAMFLRFHSAIFFFLIFATCSVGAACLIELEVWVPPYDPTDLRRGNVGEAISVSLVAAALALPAALKELRNQQAIRRESAARNEAETERARFQSVVNASYGAIVEADAQGRIRFVEGPLIEAFGYKEEDLVGQQQLSFIASTDRFNCKALEKDRSGANREFRLKDASGESCWVSGSLAVLDEDEARRYVTAIRDIRQEVLSRERLQEMERLEGLATVCAGLAHDFNNLLTVFGVLFEQIDDAQLREDLLAAHQQATDLTKGLLMFANRGGTAGQPTLLKSFIEDMRPIVSHIAGATVQCHWTFDCQEQLVQLERSRLQQLIVNLVTNARHAMPEGGHLNLRFQQTDSKTEVSERNSQDRAFVRIQVADDGVGMDQRTLARAVEPFFTTKPRGVGTGLGLSTTHGTVASAGGKMQIESQPNEGTTVTVLLPLANGVEPASFGAPAEDNTVVDSGASYSIALVEDRKQLADTLIVLLQSSGHSVRAYQSAEDLLASGDINSIEWLISDVELPGQTGIDLAEQLLASQPNLKVILMSGHHVGRSINHLDSVVFLEKPFSLQQLTEIVSGSPNTQANSAEH